MLRALLALLLLLNAAFFAWTHGWLSSLGPPPQQSEREPARLATQVRPELIRVVPPQVASAAVASARETVCLETGPLADVDMAATEALLGATGLAAGSWSREAAGPQVWLIRVTRADGEARQRLQEPGSPAAALSFKPCAPTDAAPAASTASSAGKPAPSPAASRP